jgi:hypothetical protein
LYNQNISDFVIQADVMDLALTRPPKPSLKSDMSLMTAQSEAELLVINGSNH